jgi:hypothetical protein
MYQSRSGMSSKKLLPLSMLRQYWSTSFAYGKTHPMPMIAMS